MNYANGNGTRTNLSTPEAVRAQRIALLTLVVSSFALPLLLSSITVALPSVARALRMDAIQLSWVQLTFLTTSAACVLAFGRLADLLGRKLIFTLGTLALLVSSVLAASSQSAEMLLLCRVLQAVLSAEAARPALEDVGVMEEAIEHGGDGGVVAEELAPVFDGPIRRDERARAFIAAHDELE